MSQVRPGDIIFSYFGGRIAAVSMAVTTAYDSARPEDLGNETWGHAGKRIDVQYRDIKGRLTIADLVPDLRPLLPELHSPLNRNGTGNQGYLFVLPARAGRFLLDRIAAIEPDTEQDAIEVEIARAVTDSTVRQAMVQSRIGQGRFRYDVMEVWDGRCAVTGLDVPVLLRASHIKPWRDSDNRERLDKYNGLLLSPTYDAAFDAGLITFDVNGEIIISAKLTEPQAGQLGFNAAARISGLRDEHRDYLNHHRLNVFASS
jgi:hypothetical protein